MHQSLEIDRRQLLRMLSLSSGALLSGQAYSAMPGMDAGLERGYVRSEFGQIHYWSVGQGPVLLMLHQSAQTSSEYLAIAPFLCDYFRVIAIDLPNHGQSETPDHELTMDEYGDAVIHVLDGLGIDRAHMLGQHGGGTVVINVGLRYPSRVGKVILSGAGREEDVDIEALISTPMTRDLPVDSEGDFLAKTWAVYRKMSASNTLPETTFQPFLNALIQRQRRFDMHYAAYRWDFLPLLSGFEKETLLIQAEEDVFAGDVAGLQKRIRGSVLRTVADCGSWQFFEKPAENAQLILSFFNKV